MAHFLLESEDDELGQPSRRKFWSHGKLIFALCLSLIFGASTLATNFSINNGSIEFGQGIFQVSACDGWISVGLYPTAATYDGLSKVQSVELVGLNPERCAGSLLKLQMYSSETTTPLNLYVGAVETSTADAAPGSPWIDSATSITVQVSSTLWNQATQTYSNYASKALTIIDETGANIGYSNEYLSISYNKSTANYKIYMFQPLCYMNEVSDITIQTASLPSS
ncbi:MAG: hypothetical protein QNK54_03680 [Candidatus Planktophila sp.]